MASEIVRQGQAAWRRLKRSSKSWDDWKAVGHALLEGRAIAMRNAGTTSPSGGGYSGAFNDWLTYHRFEMSPSDRAKLLVVMEILPAVEAWRASLKPLQRARLNSPGSTLHRYRKATGITPALAHVSPAPPPA